MQFNISTAKELLDAIPLTLSEEDKKSILDKWKRLGFVFGGKNCWDCTYRFQRMVVDDNSYYRDYINSGDPVCTHRKAKKY